MSDWSTIGFSENLIREDLLIPEDQELDPLAFDQFISEISASKIKGGILTSRNGNIEIDLDNEFISVKDGTIEKIRFGQYKGAFDYFFLNDNLGTLFDKTSGANVTAVKEIISATYAGTRITITHPDSAVIPGTKVTFTLSKTQLVILEFIMNTASNTATVQGIAHLYRTGGTLESSNTDIWSIASGTGRTHLSQSRGMFLNSGTYTVELAMECKGGVGDTITVDYGRVKAIIFN